MNKIQWIKQEIWNGVQTVWSVENNKSISIVRDRRDESNTNYPYMVHVDGEYHGHYKHLAIAKRDALIYANMK